MDSRSQNKTPRTPNKHPTTRFNSSQMQEQEQNQNENAIPMHSGNSMIISGPYDMNNSSISIQNSKMNDLP
jgi:hypothetical protein